MPEQIGMIQGKVPDSVEEYRVALSLTKFGWEFQYQYPILGGRSVKGGMIPDFLVETAPNQTALYVNGAYWHGSKQQQIDEIQQQFLVGKMDLSIVVVTDDQLKTQQESDETIVELLGRNS